MCASHNPLTALTLADLRERRSVKWRAYDCDVLPLWVAEMDTPLAEPISAALVAAIGRGDTGYAHPGRLPEAYAEFATRRFGWTPDPARTLVVADVMSGIVEVLRAVTAPGDAVVVNPPVYPPFYAFLAHAQRRPVEAPLQVGEDGGYRLDLAALEAAFAAGARAYLLCNPHNPTGTVFDRDSLLAVAELADRYGVRLLVDEIHSPLVYPGAVHIPFLSLAEEPGVGLAAARAVSFVSASKAWNLPGLKAALAIGGPAASSDLARIPVHAQFGAGLLGVIAAEAALREGVTWLEELLAGLAANRALLGEVLAERLPEVRYRPPDATYLAWLDCRALGLGDDPAAVFLDRGRVAVNPGLSFGTGGAGFVRLNFATAPERLTEAVDRMARAAGR